MKQQKSPFKFLDAYQKEDKAVFFGRDKETKDLYNALSRVKHLLVYGPSGAGKTSLIECGLRNRFSIGDWYALTIRRRGNIMTSIYASINDALDEKIALNANTGLPLEDEWTFEKAIEKLFEEYYQPIYLLFDQFEELLILGTKEEKIEFFERLDSLIRFRLPCRVILIMREEFIGHLSGFEEQCPSIFQYRFRVEKMARSNVRSVIYQMLTSSQFESDFAVENSEQLANDILTKLPDDSEEIELTHVQVYLEELWDRAIAAQDGTKLPVFHKGLVKEKDNLESVLNTFLQKQLRELDQTYGHNIPLEILAAMISERHTKLQMSELEVQKVLSERNVTLEKSLSSVVTDLTKRSILRPLKTGETTRYEIRHDLLALVVGQNLTEEMRLREKARDVYVIYGERQGFFSQEELDYLRPFEEYMAYPVHIKERIIESNQHLTKTTRRRNSILTGLTTLSLVFALSAGYFGFDATQKEAEATFAKNTAQENLVKVYKAEINRYQIEIGMAESNIRSYKRFNADRDVISLDSIKKVSLELKIDTLSAKIKSLTQ